MANDSILAVDVDIDDHIQAFCKGRPQMEPSDVIRDIARIVCIVNLVRNGILDGTNMVLCGGMAMRCLDSPRMSIYDGDTASRTLPDPRVLPAQISHDEDDMEIVAAKWESGKDLITFTPVSYDARFSELAGAQEQFSLSVAHRGIEGEAIWRPLNHRYPFPVLAQAPDVPIMNPDEILAEKVVAWWLFGHAKHYNDIAFLAGRLLSEGTVENEGMRGRVRAIIKKKLEINESVSEDRKRRVAALTDSERRRRLASPIDHVDPKRDFNMLSYLQDVPPPQKAMDALVQRVLMPVIFE